MDDVRMTRRGAVAQVLREFQAERRRWFYPDYRPEMMDVWVDRIESVLGITDEPDGDPHAAFMPVEGYDQVPPRPVTDEDFAALPILKIPEQFDGDRRG